MAQEKKANKHQGEPVKVSVKEILDFLNRGYGREHIAEHYGLTKAQLKRIMMGNEKLKNARVKPTVPVILIDDTVEGEAIVTDLSAPAQGGEQATIPLVQEATTSDATRETPTTVEEGELVKQAASGNTGMW